jgi:hypothetical protein
MTTYARSFDFLFNQMRNGSVGSLAAGSVTFYAAGTTTPKAVWLDRVMTLPTTGGITTPYTLTADGTASLFGYGLYKVIVKDSTGVTVYTYDNVEMLSSDLGSQFVTIPTELVFDSLVGNTTQTFATGTLNVTAIRVDASAFFARIALPAGYSMAGSGDTSYYLTGEGETVNLYLPAGVGLVYYKV